MTCFCAGRCPHIGAAIALREKQQFPAAHQKLRQILLDAPNCVEANTAFAAMFTHSNHAYLSVAYVEAAAANGWTPALHMEMGAALRGVGRLEAATEHFFSAVRESAIPRHYAALIAALEASDQWQAADSVIDEARARYPADKGIRRSAGVTYTARKDYARALALWNLPDDELQAIELLDRGRAKEESGDYAGAWWDWMAGKEALEKRGEVKPYNYGFFEARFRELARVARRRTWAKIPKNPANARPGEPVPLFVTGFPRSGTTMLETSLSAHSRIAAGDELMGVHDSIELMNRIVAARVGYPASFLALSLPENHFLMPLLQAHYMKQAARKIAWDKAPLYFTDKMPLQNVHLPFVRAMLPDSHMVHIARHPLDVLVSCMSHWLIHGGNYASSPQNFSDHYLLVDRLNSEYRRAGLMVEHFKTVRYESFVADPAAALVELLPPKVELEPACVEFHKNPRHARTISYRQVRQPVNDKSVGRWKPFADFLKPVTGQLQELCEREGYATTP